MVTLRMANALVRSSSTIWRRYMVAKMVAWDPLIRVTTFPSAKHQQFGIRVRQSPDAVHLSHPTSVQLFFAIDPASILTYSGGSNSEATTQRFRGILVHDIILVIAVDVSGHLRFSSFGFVVVCDQTSTKQRRIHPAFNVFNNQ